MGFFDELHNLEAEVAADYEAAKKELAKDVKSLEGKTQAELHQLHDDAIAASDKARKELSILRQRAANMATDVTTEVDHEIIKAKVEVARAEAWIKEIAHNLVGEFKIWG